MNDYTMAQNKIIEFYVIAQVRDIYQFMALINVN